MGRRSLIDEDTQEKVADAYIRGEPIADICNRLGVNEGSVYYIIRKRGIPRRRATPDYSQAVVEYTSTDTPVMDILMKYNIRSAATLYAALRRKGLPLRTEVE